jgi:anti-sigma factor RsiW
MPRLSLRLRRPRPGLTCQELVELVTDYVEEMLPAGERRRFERHIAGCDGCTAYVEQLRATLAVMGRLEPEALSPEAERDLLAAFRDWRDDRD